MWQIELTLQVAWCSRKTRTRPAHTNAVSAATGSKPERMKPASAGMENELAEPETDEPVDQAAAASQRSLTPSSSRSSLSSTSSNGAATASGGLSQKSRLELQAYFSSFTKAKAAKRRPSLM